MPRPCHRGTNSLAAYVDVGYIDISSDHTGREYVAVENVRATSVLARLNLLIYNCTIPFVAIEFMAEMEKLGRSQRLS